jgi:hypothetical protein
MAENELHRNLALIGKYLEELQKLQQYIELCVEHCPDLETDKDARIRVELLINSYRSESASWLEEMEWSLKKAQKHLTRSTSLPASGDSAS